MGDQSWLPALLAVDWNEYADSLEVAYRAFQEGFGSEAHRPRFFGRRLGLKRHPESAGKSATFWHFVTEGSDEASRTPDGARLERIRWPHAMIAETNRQPPRVRVWRTTRGSATRWLIALHDFSYVVVLDERKDYLLPWTAFVVEHEHRREKFRKEWRAWNGSPKS